MEYKIWEKEVVVVKSFLDTGKWWKRLFRISDEVKDKNIWIVHIMENKIRSITYYGCPYKDGYTRMVNDSTVRLRRPALGTFLIIGEGNGILINKEGEDKVFKVFRKLLGRKKAFTIFLEIDLWGEVKKVMKSGDTIFDLLNPYI